MQGLATIKPLSVVSLWLSLRCWIVAHAPLLPTLTEDGQALRPCAELTVASPHVERHSFLSGGCLTQVHALMI